MTDVMGYACMSSSAGADDERKDKAGTGDYEIVEAGVISHKPLSLEQRNTIVCDSSGSTWCRARDCERVGYFV